MEHKENLTIKEEFGWYACCVSEQYLLIDKWVRLSGCETIVHCVDDPVNNQYANGWFRDYEAPEDTHVYATKEECEAAHKGYCKAYAKEQYAKSDEEKKEMEDMWMSIIAKIGKMKYNSLDDFLGMLSKLKGNRFRFIWKSDYEALCSKSNVLDILEKGSVSFHVGDDPVTIPLRSIDRFYRNSDDNTVVYTRGGEYFIKKGASLYVELCEVFGILNI